MNHENTKARKKRKKGFCPFVFSYFRAFVIFFGS